MRAGGVSGREEDGGRQREEGTPVRENPGADRDLDTDRGLQGGQPDRGRQARLARGTPWAATNVMGGKRRRAVAVGGPERRPGERSLRDLAREGGE